MENFAARFKPERIKGNDTLYLNLSTQTLSEILRFFPNPNELRADKIIILPDFSPTRAPLPTGCAVVINEDKQPDWRKYTLSDIGCGMQVVKSQLNWPDFNDNLRLWDRVAQNLKRNRNRGLGDLGSGNHFLDAVVDKDEAVYFVVHTGSRDQSKRVEKLLDQPEEFDQTFEEVVNWARGNRDKVVEILSGVYGDLEFVLDKPHNFYLHQEEEVSIYKGAVQLKPGEINLIPSSMDSQMVLVTGTDKLAEVNFAMSHGTGRIKSRGKSKMEAADFDFNTLRRRIYIPRLIPNRSVLSEVPSSYRPLDQCLQALEGLVEIQKTLVPIAYIGQL